MKQQEQQQQDLFYLYYPRDVEGITLIWAHCCQFILKIITVIKKVQKTRTIKIA